MHAEGDETLTARIIRAPRARSHRTGSQAHQTGGQRDCRGRRTRPQQATRSEDALLAAEQATRVGALSQPQAAAMRGAITARTPQVAGTRAAHTAGAARKVGTADLRLMPGGQPPSARTLSVPLMCSARSSKPCRTASSAIWRLMMQLPRPQDPPRLIAPTACVCCHSGRGRVYPRAAGPRIAGPAAPRITPATRCASSAASSGAAPQKTQILGRWRPGLTPLTKSRLPVVQRRTR